MSNPNPAFWAGKRVLLTGHTGFKGCWMAIWLKRLGAIVTGLSLPAGTVPNLFTLAHVSELLRSEFCDIRDREHICDHIREAAPEIVLHLAAQPLVRASYRDPVETFAINVIGTVHVLDALRQVDSIRVIVVVTTDKVYANCECIYPFREEDMLGGYDPYSASKAASEIVVASYRDSFLREQGVAVATVRAGNVIGGGDWSEDRLIPDAIRTWQNENTLFVRSPGAVRPWQHVLEPLSSYLVLAEKLWSNPSLAGPWNFGPETGQATTVREVIELAHVRYGEGSVVWGDGLEGPHEVGYLALEIAKARHVLGIRPRWSLTTAIEKTMDWYRAVNLGADARVLCDAQIVEYEAGE
ncbi:MAG: CDP-glucose 4,6-dehydratase [Deltaproteobacteria bacterium]|nr:CDP-glucose 4,6-dehydratase [Deltaproteobacteria bacterium]